jgi:hypothetical protein
MTTQAKFPLKGFEAYLEDIQQAGLDIDGAAQRALTKGAPILQNEMLRLVPVGDAAEGDEHPGNLKEHIQIDGPHQEGNVNFIEVGVIHDSSFTDAMTSIYGNVQEYGSPSKHIPPHPYIRPSIDTKRRLVMKTFKQSLVEEGFVDP